MERTINRISMALGGFTLLVVLTVVGQAAAQTCVQPPPNMTSWWQGDRNADDITGGHDGALLGDATFAEEGMVDQAFSLDGVGDYVQIPHNADLDPGTGSFSLDAWVKTSQATGFQVVVGKYECGQTCISNVTNSFYFLDVIDGMPHAVLRDTDSGDSQDLFGVTFIADGNFHHLAMVRDMATSELRLYVDGLLNAIAPLTAGATGAIKDDDGEPDPLLIGASIHGGTTTRENFFSGLIDEVEFYNRALSPIEILAIFEANSAGKCKIRFVGQTSCTSSDSGFDATKAALDSPWLSVAVGQTTQVAKVEIPLAINPEDVDFQSTDPTRATVSPVTASSSPQTLQVTGITAGLPLTIGAFLNGDLVRSLGVAVYQKRTVTVAAFIIAAKHRKAHPKGGCLKPNPGITMSSLQNGLNRIWDQAAVEFIVTRFAEKTVDFDTNANCILDQFIPGQGLGPERKAIVDTIRDLDVDINIYYIQDYQIDSASTIVTDKLTFIQDSHPGVSTETITAHEIGHSLMLHDVNDINRLMHEDELSGNNCFMNKPEWDTSNATATAFKTARILSRVGDSSLTPTLEQYADSPDKVVAELSRQGLAKLGDRRYLAEILAELDAEDEHVRSEAFRKLAYIADKATVPQIAPFLWNLDAPAPTSRHVEFIPYRFLAAWALSQIIDNPPVKKDLAALYTEQDIETWKAWWGAHQHEYP